MRSVLSPVAALLWIEGELICCDEEGTDVQTIYRKSWYP